MSSSSRKTLGTRPGFGTAADQSGPPGVGEDLCQAVLDLLRPEDVQIGREGGEHQAQEAVGVVEPEDGRRDERGGRGHGLDCSRGQEDHHHEERAPAGETQDDNQGGDLGCPELLFVVEEVVDAGSPATDGARKPTSSLWMER